MKLNITVTGTVLSVSDEEREFADKDKDGNKLLTSTKHRITKISLLVKDGKSVVPCTVNGFDLPSTFPMPRETETWTTPVIVSLEQRFNAFPEIKI